MLDLDGPLHRAITPGETYFVVEIGNDAYRVVDDAGDPILYPKAIFKVLDAALPSGWRFEEYADDEYRLRPACASMAGFYEDFFFCEGDVNATNAARRTVREMLEAALLEVAIEDQRIIRRDLARLTRELPPGVDSRQFRSHPGLEPDRPARSGDPMTNVDIVIDETSMRARNGGRAIAAMSVTFGDRAFPAPGWTDFVVVVLTWWADALAELFQGTDVVTVLFMDGPYGVQISRPPGDVLQFRALEGSGRMHETARGEAPRRSFAVAVVSAARRVLAECERQGWRSTDTEALTTALASLERAIGRDTPAG